MSNDLDHYSEWPKVADAVIEATKPMQKTPSIGRDIEEWEVHEVQIPVTKIEL